METRRYHSLLGDMGGAKHSGEVEVGLDVMEKCQAALTKLFIPEYDSRGVGAFRGLREAYVTLTGDSDIRGFINLKNLSPDLRSCQDFDSSSFSTALGNTMNMYLSKKYKEFPYHEEVLISEKKKATDLRKVHSEQVGYFGELPDVDTETEDYSTLAPYADTEAQYEIGKKGAVVWVTDSVIINDNIGLIQGMVDRMSRSARVAHAKYVWNFYINNATCPDGTAWFTIGHGNLGTNALDISPLVTAITALANMTEPDPSNEKIGLDLATFNWSLVAPIALWDLAVKKNQQDSYFSANDLTTKEPNPCQKLFGDRNERIITCPFLTDANDWGVIRDREDVPIVEMSYLSGREVPEFISVWGPTSKKIGPGAPVPVFKNDKLGFKVRHEYGGTLVDYRGAYKAIIV
ncbi:MAG: hypothetical protein NTZ24_13825 [Deltaproteobacteria bacterium]|nr:hypothetical protein [Deltaproteobacteria bacterium]